ncbi:MAG TPA: hypothetical protein VMZ05_02255 [Spirochaetota bacterium]|nr:hypothetical protein [Spirochaetota bacterium]
MYLVLVKENGKHTLSGIGEDINEVKTLISKQKLENKIENGKAYLVEGVIKVIRPETTPELFDIKEGQKKSDKYY